MKLISMLCALLCCSAVCYAQEVTEVPPVELAPTDALSDIYVRHYLPQGKRVKLLDEELHAFTFEEYLQLLQMDSDLQSANLKNVELETKFRYLEKVISEQKIALRHADEARARSDSEVVRLEELFRTTVDEQARQIDRVRRRAKIGWGLAGASTVGLVSLILGLVLGG